MYASYTTRKVEQRFKIQQALQEQARKERETQQRWLFEGRSLRSKLVPSDESAPSLDAFVSFWVRLYCNCDPMPTDESMVSDKDSKSVYDVALPDVASQNSYTRIFRPRRAAPRRSNIFFMGMVLLACMARATEVEEAVFAEAMNTESRDTDTLTTSTDDVLDIAQPIEVEIAPIPIASSDGSEFCTHPPQPTLKSTYKLGPSKELSKWCKGFEDPKITTLVIADWHGDCDQANFECAAEFAKFKGGSIDLFVETLECGQYTSCMDVPTQREPMDYSSIASRCSGWNAPDFEAIQQDDREIMAFDAIKRHLLSKKEVHRKIPAEQQEKVLRKEFEDLVSSLQNQRKQAEKEHEQNFKEYRKTHPEVAFAKFTSSAKRLAAVQETQIRQVTQILGIFRETHDIGRAFNSITSTLGRHNLKKRLGSVERSIVVPNRYLWEELARMGSTPSVAIVGVEHVSERHAANVVARRAVRGSLDALSPGSFVVALCPAAAAQRR
ncbi:hypothetical protein BH10PSE19_BH10PSE19_01150 [soil metagenome]